LGYLKRGKVEGCRWRMKGRMVVVMDNNMMEKRIEKNRKKSNLCQRIV
jgi:hypothetical protein